MCKENRIKMENLPLSKEECKEEVSENFRSKIKEHYQKFHGYELGNTYAIDIAISEKQGIWYISEVIVGSDLGPTYRATIVSNTINNEEITYTFQQINTYDIYVKSK